jgi:hypothetical protein
MTDEAIRETLRTALRLPSDTNWTLDQMAALAHIRLVNLEHFAERVRDSPQATEDIKRAAESYCPRKDT